MGHCHSVMHEYETRQISFLSMRLYKFSKFFQVYNSIYHRQIVIHLIMTNKILHVTPLLIHIHVYIYIYMHVQVIMYMYVHVFVCT